MISAALHLHSTYSDGELTLGELRAVLSAAGCRLACVTDHAEAFAPASLAAYVAECERLSDDAFRFVAGLEFTCEDRMHVLGYGVTAPAETADPQAVIRHVEQHGGVSVIAHPKDAHFAWIEGFAVLPQGIETWNTKYDGRYAPRPETFALLARLQQRRPEMRAFYGIDLHHRTQPRRLLTTIAARSPARDDVLAALAGGEFAGAHGSLVLPSSGELPADLTARFQRINRRAGAVRRLAKRAARRVPAPAKAPLRRFF
jgi:predicted metal-dependent phosphoesterase TrpH